MVLSGSSKGSLFFSLHVQIITLLILSAILSACLSGSNQLGAGSDNEPLALPPTIAKATKGIDPTSLKFSVTSDSSDSSVVGTLEGNISGCTTGSDSGEDVGLSEGGSLVTVEKTEDCSFEISFKSLWQNKTVAIGFYENDAVTEQFNILVNSDKQLFVYLTDTADLQNQPFAVSKEGHVVYHGQDSSGNMVLKQFSVYGGETSTLGNSLSAAYVKLQWNNHMETPHLFGTDTQQSLFEIGAEEIVDMTPLLSEDSGPASPRQFAFMYDTEEETEGEWLVTNVQTKNTSGQNTESLAIIDLNDTDFVHIVSQEIAGLLNSIPVWGPIGSLWQVRQNGDVSEIFNLFQTHKETISNDKLEDISAVDAYDPFSTTQIIEEVVGVDLSGGYDTGFYYPCAGDDDTVGLCLAEPICPTCDMTVVVVFSSDGIISNIEGSSSGSYVAYEKSNLDGSKSATECTSSLMIYSAANDLNVDAGDGCAPQSWSKDENMLFYRCKDLDGDLQICLLRLSELFGNDSDATLIDIESGDNTSFIVGQCEPSFISVEDAAGTQQEVGWVTRINLDGDGVTFYSDPVCLEDVTYTTIEKDSSLGFFYLKSSTEGSKTITAIDNSGYLTGTTEDIIFEANNNPPTKLKITQGSNDYKGPVAVGNCYVHTVETLDTSDNLAKAKTTTTVALSAQYGEIYSDEDCTHQITSTTISAGASTVQFYYVTTVVGPEIDTTSETLTASASDLSSGQLNFSVTLIHGGLDFVGSNKPVHNVCTEYYLLSTSAFGDDVEAPVAEDHSFSLTVFGNEGDTALESLDYYSDANCSSQITTITMPAGEARTASFYFKGVLSQSFINAHPDVANMGGTPIYFEAETSQDTWGVPPSLPDAKSYPNLYYQSQ